MKTIIFAIILQLLHVTIGLAEEKQNTSVNIASELDKQLQMLDKIQQLSPCQKSVAIALKNDKVRKIFLSKVTNPCYTLKDLCCLDIPHIPEREYVLFNFDCKPPCFCIIDPQFLVIIDTIKKKVVTIEDPYSGPTKPCRSIRKQATDAVDESVNRVAIATTRIEGVISGCDVIRNGNEFRMYAFVTDPNSGNEVQVTTRFDAFQRILLAASNMREVNTNNKKPLVEVEYLNQSPHYVRRIRVLDR